MGLEWEWDLGLEWDYDKWDGINGIWDGIWDSPNPIYMGGKYRRDVGDSGRCGVSTNLTNPQEKSRDQVSMIGCGNQVIASVPTISEETVVDTINQWRRDINILEDNMVATTKNILLNSEILRDYVTPKVEELKNIFVSCGEEMEWTAIEKEVYGDTRAAELHEVIQKYTTLNNEFTKRVKEENRETDEKNINNKRAAKNVMEKEYKKRWRIEDSKVR
ncbi:hypothetical protein RhiirA4_477264 [Rhizophagus irregularis]|uniref:Uncharacterized protein n=1 Tax=Rhizophagus irregularis TaxID=588596 RepID=A0A2I1HCY1_9GLOM|nr:hypothetical protein RhiirA4_477264 [Rhizophagus irregularis]